MTKLQILHKKLLAVCDLKMHLPERFQRAVAIRHNQTVVSITKPLSILKFLLEVAVEDYLLTKK